MNNKPLRRSLRENFTQRILAASLYKVQTHPMSVAKLHSQQHQLTRIQDGVRMQRMFSLPHRLNNSPPLLMLGTHSIQNILHIPQFNPYSGRPPDTIHQSLQQELTGMRGGPQRVLVPKARKPQRADRNDAAKNASGIHLNTQQGRSRHSLDKRIR